MCGFPQFQQCYSHQNTNMGSLPRYVQTVCQEPSIPNTNQLPQNDALNALMNELKSSCEAQVERIASINNLTNANVF